jgi:DNA-binding SARP family transcriptional activator
MLKGVSMKTSLRIQLLGSPRVSHGDVQAADFPTEKVKLLFFYLVLFRDVAHARSALAGLCWGDSPEALARHSLNTALWRLRHWLEPLQNHVAPYLLLEDQQIQFNGASAYWLDTAEFEERINWARQMNATAPDQAAAALHRAVELYHGDLLEGCYGNWCLAERDRLHQLFLQSLVHLMLYHGGRHEYAQAITFAQRVLQEDPLREEVQRELMKLFLLHRQPAKALLQYRRCEAALREELGIEPMPETQAVFRQLILKSESQPIALASSVARNPETVGNQLQPLLQRIDAALETLTALRQEVVVALETFSQNKSAPALKLKERRERSQSL